MTEQGLLDAFNDCLDRINAGQGIEDSLRRYPQYATALRPMLEVGKLVERAQVNAFEVESAQARVRARMNARLSAPPRRSPVVARYALLAASLLITLAAVLGMAESSLPGDSLYGLKQVSESVRSAVTGDQFAQRRLDETRILLALKRAAQVTFVGDVERIDGDLWTVAGLALRVPLGTPGAENLAVSDFVRVDAETTAAGALVAQSLTLLEPGDQLPTPTAAFTETLAPTLTATASPTSSATPSPTSTASPSATATATTPTPTATLPTTTPVSTRATATPLLCAPTRPTGWITYVVQSGDAVAALASRTGTTVEEVVAVNCLPDSLMILIGDSLFLPSQPPAPAPTQAPATAAPQPQPTVDDHGGGDNQSGDDNSGSGSNSGSGNSGHGGGDSGGDDHGGSGGDD